MAYNNPNLTPREADIEKERARANQRWFTADAAQTAELNRLIDTPLESTAKLEALAARPSVFSSK